jgi:hypothetical protein
VSWLGDNRSCNLAKKTEIAKESRRKIKDEGQTSIRKRKNRKDIK